MLLLVLTSYLFVQGPRLRAWRNLFRPLRPFPVFDRLASFDRPRFSRFPKKGTVNVSSSFFSLFTFEFNYVLSFPGSACYYAEVPGLLVRDFFSIFFLAFFLFRGSLLNNTLSTSFLRPFPWRGKGKDPGTKVEHTVIYVLGQYSKRYRASFILHVNVENIFK